jgi:dihydroxyacetone kinase DhaKLM complex PTS-EIIA-like component DhaM
MAGFVEHDPDLADRAIELIENIRTARFAIAHAFGNDNPI